MTQTKQIPSSFNVGGARIEVIEWERLENSNAGECSIAEGCIKIAQRVFADSYQAKSIKRNTFYHELTHAILDTMGEMKLSSNEKFVCCFSGFLCEAMSNAVFLEEEGGNL